MADTAIVSQRQPGVIHMQVQGDVRMIQPRCDLTGAVSETLRTLLFRELRTPNRRYRIDLGDVRIIDSASLSILLCFVRMLRHSKPGAELRITGASGLVERELRYADIDALGGVEVTAAT